MTNIKENSIGHGLSMNKIYNMDCIEGIKLIPDGSIDAIITTAIACLNTNRNYIGFELDEGYYDIANKRIQDRLSENTLFS